MIPALRFLWDRRRHPRAKTYVAAHPVRSYRFARSSTAPCPWNDRGEDGDRLYYGASS